MKIMQVVTLVSDSGAFGGPLRVALNQTKELRDRGHHVQLLAGWCGRGSPPAEVDNVRLEAFSAFSIVPWAGFSGLHSSGLQRAIRRNLRSTDVVHVHAGRDLTSLLALYAVIRNSVPTLVQTHGMIAIDKRIKARIIDALAVRCLVGEARFKLVLTEDEEAELSSVLRSRSGIRRLRNGVPLPAAMATEYSEVNVLFCARLQARKRPMAFVQMAADVSRIYPEVTFSIVGPDEGSLDDVITEINRLGLSSRIRYEGALTYDAVLKRMRKASIYVLPSVNEPFPMSLLEALSLGLACICTDSCGIAPVLQERGAALVTDGSRGQLTQACIRLLEDPGVRRNLGGAARKAVTEAFSMNAVANRLESLYLEACTDRATLHGR